MANTSSAPRTQAKSARRALDLSRSPRGRAGCPHLRRAHRATRATEKQSARTTRRADRAFVRRVRPVDPLLRARRSGLGARPGLCSLPRVGRCRAAGHGGNRPRVERDRAALGAGWGGERLSRQGRLYPRHPAGIAGRQATAGPRHRAGQSAARLFAGGDPRHSPPRSSAWQVHRPRSPIPARSPPSWPGSMGAASRSTTRSTRPICAVSRCRYATPPSGDRGDQRANSDHAGNPGPARTRVATAGRREKFSRISRRLGGRADDPAMLRWIAAPSEEREGAVSAGIIEGDR